jgi:hypothetical protein
MRVITLVRKYHPTGTNGQLSFDGRLICHTIELPWRDNERSVSCIPEGRYMLSLRWTSRWGWHFQILKVPDRDWILIHPANCALRELRGCIAPVMDLTGPGNGLRSREAITRLYKKIEPILRSGTAVQLIIQS